MALALFDLDHTLLNGDSDQLWGDFLYERHWVDERYQRDKDAFFADYQHGKLDIQAFARLVLAPVKGKSERELEALRQLFAQQKIAPQLRADGLRYWHKHRQAGDLCIIITATNRFIASAAADILAADALIASEPEIIGDTFSGELCGIPAFRDGKVARLVNECARQNWSLTDACFYSDSHNDLPLLNYVANPIAVTPDAVLRQVAQMNAWPILEWQ